MYKFDAKAGTGSRRREFLPDLSLTTLLARRVLHLARRIRYHAGHGNTQDDCRSHSPGTGGPHPRKGLSVMSTETTKPGDGPWLNFLTAAGHEPGPPAGLPLLGLDEYG